MKFIPGSNAVEGFFNKYTVAFTLVVMYQAIFVGASTVEVPERLRVISTNVFFRIFTLFAIAFTATKDVEVSVLSVALFIAMINIIKTPEERKNRVLL
tara:strand:- start:174 stop:467 length:294 start_codon:yes stop_codon:yes gene_type:complete